MLQLYLDTVNRTVAEPLLRTGLFAGVTTNPSLLRRAGLSWAELPAFHSWAVGHGARDVFFQAVGGSAEDLARSGRELAAIGPRVVVKVPATRAGVEAAASLVRDGVPVLLTAVYHPAQALVAAAVGARYLAPYVGRMSDNGRPGVEGVAAMVRVLRGTGARAEILAASLRGVEDVVALAEAGVTAFALPPQVAEALLADPLTEQAAADFEEAARELRSTTSKGADS
ncbi:fructose-6-phosphate aldolase 1 [Microtetraspora sp. NBRC 13810]|uniref:transaldolase family protein n=1 Tax=Microtetraspora sp. NBRC 13810 TaxID=3030990 RepID=UPI00249FD65F|nr:transaldolase family protein [Microtetraspora sp. NBRC 13810]GLW07085.1 fructose-6-phosphate aldolase 1 [Microtetraspora sp. NBRC 13810]